MMKIQALVDAYNQANNKFYPSEVSNGFNMLNTLLKASDEDIDTLEKMVGVDIPNELKLFYKTFGGLENKNNTESYCIRIDDVPTMIKHLSNGDKWSGLHSAGLIDMILFSWANDRIELSPNEYFTTDQIAALNHGYKCIGWYRTDTIGETAYYLFFDKDGKFGKIYYDQDAFYELEHNLITLLSKSTASQTLEELLVASLEEIRLTMIEWKS